MKLIKDLGQEYATEKSNRTRRYAIYECEECNNTYRLPVTTKERKSIACRSCTFKNRLTKHGESGTRLYRIWGAIKTRCYNKKQKHYGKYGGRGIKLCEEWHDYIMFKAWSMEHGYNKSLSIDRIDNNGNYEPSNCRWTTNDVQTQNTRLRVDNTSGYRGVSFHPVNKNWVAVIYANKKRIRLGSFEKKKDAALAYDNYVKCYKLNHTLNNPI